MNVMCDYVSSIHHLSVYAKEQSYLHTTVHGTKHRFKSMVLNFAKETFVTLSVPCCYVAGIFQLKDMP